MNPLLRVLALVAFVQSLLHDAATSPRDERGEIEQVTILKGLFAAAALAIGAIIVAKFTGAANNIPTGP